MKKSRRKFNAKFKVVMESLSERLTSTELTQKHSIHVNQLNKWKREFKDKAEVVFSNGSTKPLDPMKEKENLYKIIGQQKEEIDFLKKALS